MCITQVFFSETVHTLCERKVAVFTKLLNILLKDQIVVLTFIYFCFVFLWPAVPPTVRIEQRTMQANVGQTVTMSCEVTGSPQPRIQWRKEGDRLPNEHFVQDGILTYVKQLAL